MNMYRIYHKHTHIIYIYIFVRSMYLYVCKYYTCHICHLCLQIDPAYILRFPSVFLDPPPNIGILFWGRFWECFFFFKKKRETV